MPNVAYQIEHLQNGTAEILFTENVKEIIRKDSTEYEYDQYRLVVADRTTLNANIEANYDKWLQYAKDMEIDQIGGELRVKRTKLLAETDWTQSTDSPLPLTKKAEWAAYRQALRDMPEQQEFPYDVRWPELPK